MSTFLHPASKARFDSQSGQNLIPSWQQLATAATVYVSGFVIRPRCCDREDYELIT